MRGGEHNGENKEAIWICCYNSPKLALKWGSYMGLNWANKFLAILLVLVLVFFFFLWWFLWNLSIFIFWVVLTKIINISLNLSVYHGYWTNSRDNNPQYSLYNTNISLFSQIFQIFKPKTIRKIQNFSQIFPQ
jgi:hypothetical protein